MGLQKKGCEYKFYTEFQSHEPEFDYLKSLEIEEKINKIRWCKRQNSAHFLLSTNGQSLFCIRRSPDLIHYTTPYISMTLPSFPVWGVPDTFIRQNHQALESLREVVAGSIRIELDRWPAVATTTIVETASAVTPYGASRQHHRCRSPQSILQCTRLPHPFHRCQFRPGNIRIGR